MFPARDNNQFNQKGNIAIVIIVLVLLATVAFLGWTYLKNSNFKSPLINSQTNVCTMEAKICPDGSSVGRSGDKCEFAKCPELAFSNYNDPNGYSITYPSNWTFLDTPTEGLLSYRTFGPPSESTDSAKVNQALGYIEYGPSENIISTGGDGYVGTDIYGDRFFNFRPGDWLVGDRNGYHFEKPTNLSIDTRNTMRQKVTSLSNPNLETINYYVPQDDRSGNIFFLSYTVNTENPTSTEYEKILEQMIRDLKFNN